MLLAAAVLTVVLFAVVLAPRVMAEQPVPEPDLRAAGMTGVAQLVTPFQLRSDDGGRTIMLLGAYADSARTALFLRVIPNAGTPDMTLTDGQAQVELRNSVMWGVPGAPGDYVYVFEQGPRLGPDGNAHLTAHVIGLMAFVVSSAPPEESSGSWNLSFALPVQPATAIPNEGAFQLGSSKITIEVLEVTPSVIHLQAVIEGGDLLGVSPVLWSAISLVDPSGTPVNPVAAGAEATTQETYIPKQKVIPTPSASPPNSWRVNMQWPRPPTGGAYQLRFQGNGETHTIPISLPAP